MEIVIQLISLLLCLNLATAQTGGACADCLWEVWRDSVSLEPKDLCATRSIDDVWNCLNDCEPSPADLPKTYPLRAMTQTLDALFHQAMSGCGSFTDECFAMTVCLTSRFAYYGGDNATHAPFYTVFNYICSEGVEDEAILCVQNSRCGNADQLSKLTNLMQIAYNEACNVDRRCIMHGNIFEVFPVGVGRGNGGGFEIFKNRRFKIIFHSPTLESKGIHRIWVGSDCTKYLQEALAYGPSTGNPIDVLEGLAFDTVHKDICRPEHPELFVCPSDPDPLPILSEYKPSNETTPPPNQFVDFGTIQVDLTQNCARCLHPLWDRVVTTNGSHVCDEEVEILIFKCLDVCGDNEVDIPQRNIDALVKIADLQKARQLNNCTMKVCTKTASECYEKIAHFYPMSAPHVTVNNFNCSDNALNEMLDCLTENCPDGIPATLEDVIKKGYDSVCKSDKLCMTYGNLYELVSRDLLLAANITDDEVCAYYTHAPANGYQLYARRIARVQEGLFFSTEICQPDWPSNFECPADLGVPESETAVTPVPTTVP